MTVHNNCPLISVIVPVYKVEKYLDRCIDSIIHQTYTNLEIILVDDGSPDGCPAMCDKWAEKDSRIKVIHKENGGLSSARNAGLDVASGEFFGFVDSDDYILPEMYETLCKLITENEADLSICSFEQVDERGEILQEHIDTTGTFIDEILTGDELLRKWLKVNWRYVVAVNKLYRTSVFGGMRFPLGRIHEDEFTAHHFFSMCRKAAITGQKMYFYVRRDDSIMWNARHNFNIKRMNDVTDMYIERYDFLRGKGMNDLAEITLKQAIGHIRGPLRKGSYLANMRDFNRGILWCAGKCLRSGSIKNDLRMIKTLLCVIRNIARDVYLKVKTVFISSGNAPL